jgi:hypothetical protein
MKSNSEHAGAPMALENEQEAMIGGGLNTVMEETAAPAASEKSPLRWVITTLGKLGCLMFVGVAFIIVFEVIMRFIFRKPTMWVMEISSLLTIIASFLLFAYTLQEKGTPGLISLPPWFPGGRPFFSNCSLLCSASSTAGFSPGTA